MQAFRLRGIYADGAQSFSEESLFWPKVQKDGLPRVAGLSFGDPNGLTKVEKDNNGDVLRQYAKEHALKLGFDREAGDIYAPSFHPMFHMGQDGRLFVNMVVELVQTLRLPIDDGDPRTFPLRNGVTLLISQDPAEDDKRPEPRIRFVISKLHTAEREERVRNFFLSTGRAIPLDNDCGDDDARFKINFGLLHAGV
jgi:hypothetical protein